MASKHKHLNDYDLYEDVEKIKAALVDTVFDAKGKAGEIISDSVEGVKEQSNMVKDNVVNYTTEKPLKSLGIALLTGMVIGYFLKKS